VVTTTGAGLATHFGSFTFTQQVTVNLTTGTDTGTIRFVVANGDTIDATIVGAGILIVTADGIVFSITETCTRASARGI
jgi:hypothetical protein